MPPFPSRQSPSRYHHHRRGAVLVEAAIVLSVFLTIVLGIFDLALAVLRYNCISEAARQGAREAIVHGQLAAPHRTSWGPAAYSGSAADDHEIAEAVRPSLVGIDPANVLLAVEWPDGSNAVEKRVSYTVSTAYRPILLSLFGNREFALSATSTMFIVH